MILYYLLLKGAWTQHAASVQELLVRLKLEMLGLLVSRPGVDAEQFP